MKNEGKIFTVLPAVAADIGAIGKNQKNKDQGYSFRGIDDFLNAAHAAFTKHKITVIPEVLQRDRVAGATKNGTPNVWIGLLVKYTFYAEDGSSISAVIASEGLDTSDKATNKALSAAMKYALIQVFTVPTEDVAEADRESPELPEHPAQMLTSPARESEEDAAWRKAEEWGRNNWHLIQAAGYEAKWRDCLESGDVIMLRQLVQLCRAKKN